MQYHASIENQLDLYTFHAAEDELQPKQKENKLVKIVDHLTALWCLPPCEIVL
jgi:hypothetical protein